MVIKLKRVEMRKEEPVVTKINMEMLIINKVKAIAIGQIIARIIN